MPKLTRRFKTYKNKTIKTNSSSIKKGGKYGQLYGSHEISKIDEHPKREGIIDYYENKLSGAASTVTNFAIDTGLKMVGLKRIKDEPHTENNEESTIDKVGSDVLENVNDFLKSDSLQQITEQSTIDTSQIIK